MTAVTLALLCSIGGAVEFRVTERLTVKQGLEVSTSAVSTPLLFISTTTGVGRVGIGVSNPAARLHVSSAAAVATDTVLQVSTGTGIGQELLVIKGDAKMGVWTASPLATLDVGGTGAIKLPVGTSADRPASPVAGMIRFNTVNSSVEFYNGAGWMTTVAVATPPVATGGTETTILDKGVPYRIHTFTASGSLNVTSPGYLEVLVVGGGGSGGNHNTTNGNGGGGGGGVVYRESYYVSNGAKTVTVGAGGTAIGFQVVSRGNNGGNSVFDSLTALGGGGGGSTGVALSAFDGGSGGGGAYGHYPAGNSIQTGGYGNSGGAGLIAYSGGGGGGAGSAGFSNTVNGTYPGPQGNGGRGMGFTISGSLVFYAGGGGGGGNSSERAGDGFDGGGRGAGSTNYYTYLQYPGGVSPTGGNSLLPGLANTGGGGGAGSYWTTAGNTPQCPNCGSGAGGSGIVIVRYRLLQ